MNSRSFATSESLLEDELQATLAQWKPRRVETLRAVTDLFISGAVGNTPTIRSPCLTNEYSPMLF